MCGFPRRLNRMRSIALASVAVPTVDRGSAPIRCWSTRIAVVSPSSTSTSGRASVGMNPCTKALYVSLISRCDSAAIVPNTSELLPEPETPVNTVSRRFGISMLTSLRLFSRAPCTRIRSWSSATCSAGDCGAALVAMLIVSPSIRYSPLGAAAATLHVYLTGGPWPAHRAVADAGSGCLPEAEDVTVRVLDSGDQNAAADVADLALQRGARLGHRPGGGGDVRDLPLV